MKRILQLRPSPATIISLIALAVALGGVGYAAIPDGDGTIHGCYMERPVTSRPAFRLIDPANGGVCRSYERPITWRGIDGVPAGGDLTGAYPNPTVGPDKVTSAKVANNSLTGDDVNESTLGKVPDADRLDNLDSTQLVSNGCPPLYVYVAPLCWEDIDTCCFTLAGAANRCRAQGGRLPYLPEFMALIYAGSPLASTVQLDWTASTAADDVSIFINSSSNPENPDGERANSSSSYARCVRDPINALGSP